MFVRHTVPLPNWRVLGKGVEGKSGGEENGQWKEEGIICYCKIIPVHVLVNHQIVNTLTGMKETLRKLET